MRKLSIFFAVAVFATIGFSSCENNSLKGTSWKSEVQGDEYVIFRFPTATVCEMDFYFDNEVDDTDKGTYTYSRPNVSIDLGFDATYIGTVKGNKMTLTHEDGGVLTVTKQ